MYNLLFEMYLVCNKAIRTHIWNETTESYLQSKDLYEVGKYEFVGADILNDNNEITISVKEMK